MTADDPTTPGPSSARTRVRRIAAKASYDRAVIDAILDEGLVAHVGVTTGDGPVVIPMAYARDGDRVLLHGSVASRLVRSAASGTPVCLTVTLLDAMVVARSLFESSMAYRSVVVFGTATPLDEPAAKLDALLRLSERLLPGRSSEARLPDDSELAQTRVLSVPLDESSAKISEPAVDDAPADLGLPIWAGVVPLRTAAGPPVPAHDLLPGVAVPRSVAGWSPSRPGAHG